MRRGRIRISNERDWVCLLTWVIFFTDSPGQFETRLLLNNNTSTSASTSNIPFRRPRRSSPKASACLHPHRVAVTWLQMIPVAGRTRSYPSYARRCFAKRTWAMMASPSSPNWPHLNPTTPSIVVSVRIPFPPFQNTSLPPASGPAGNSIAWSLIGRMMLVRNLLLARRWRSLFLITGWGCRNSILQGVQLSRAQLAHVDPPRTIFAHRDLQGKIQMAVHCPMSIWVTP